MSNALHVLMVLLTLSWASLAFSETSWLKKAINEYFQGNYKVSSEMLVDHDDDVSDLSDGEKADFYLLKARLAAASGHDEEMDYVLTKLYEVNPEKKLDVYIDPPILFQKWQHVKQNPPSRGLSLSLPKLDQDKLRHQARIGMSVLPYGIGHFNNDLNRDGLAFLTVDFVLTYIAIEWPKRESFKKNDLHGRVSLLGISAFLGVWGYELLHLMPEIYQQNPERAENVRAILSFAPFGVGQAKNGQYEKAIAFAIAQTAFWSLAISGNNKSIRELGIYGVAVATAYGAVDAWLNHTPWQESDKHARTLSLYPHLGANDSADSLSSALEYGVGLRYRF